MWYNKKKRRNHGFFAVFLLMNGMKNDFIFKHIPSTDLEGVKSAYEVIRLNREEHGYNLRMSLGDVMSTINVVPADFFLLSYNSKYFYIFYLVLFVLT